MGEATWEMCSAETLLEQFFVQDDLGKLKKDMDIGVFSVGQIG